MLGLFEESTLDTIADALAGRGYVVMDQLLPAELLESLLVHFDQLPAKDFTSAGVGRKTNFQLKQNIRTDKIHWISPDTEVTNEFLRWMESLRLGINRRLFIGLFDYESHFAFYPVGAFYKKHVDAFRHGPDQPLSSRVLSTVLYLNKSWMPENGGELVMYTEDDENILEKIYPFFGRMVIFLSEKFPHEVLLANEPRKSIAGWFRLNEAGRETLLGLSK